MIGVLGATGSIGRLVLAELERRGIPARRGGRIDVTDPAFYDGLDAVVSVVGPYAEVGMPVVDAAVANGVPYVDASGECGFVGDVLARHADAAVPVIPGCGFVGLLGDLAAAVAAEHFGGPVDDLAVNYAVDGGAVTRGIARSALGVLLAGEMLSIGRRRTAWFPGGARWVVEVPLVESVLVPRHVPGATVTTGVALASRVARVAPHAPALARRAGPALGWLVDRLPARPADDRRLRTTFQVVAEATGTGPRSTAVCEGRDPHGLTASLLVTAALGASRAGSRPGAMAPAEAFEAEPFLDAVSGPMLRWSFDLPEPGDLSE